MILPSFEVHEGTGLPLLMVHGFLSSSSQWLLNIEALKSVATPVVVELFGHGRSPAPANPECYLPANYVKAFEAIRQSLGIRQWNLLGYSLGAALTLRYSLTHPAFINAQIFTNSTSAFAAREPGTLEPNAEEVIGRFEREGMAAVEAIPVHPRFANRIPTKVHNPLLADCGLLDPVGVARTLVYTNGSASVRELVDQNTVPALLINGMMEKRFDPFKAFALATMPHLSCVELSAGHAVNAEDASGFNDAAKAFLTRSC